MPRTKAPTIFYATGNKGKFEEVKTYLEQNNIPINLKQFSCDIEEIQTLDQKKIALDKAKKAWEIIHKPFLIEDAAIYFDKCTSFPGPLTRFVWEGLGFEGIKKLYEPGDKAHFLLYLVYVHDAKTSHIFEGSCEGTLFKPEIFDAHPSLPYGAIFIPTGATKTYAQLRKENHNKQFDHRIRALEKFIQWFLKTKLPET